MRRKGYESYLFIALLFISGLAIAATPMWSISPRGRTKIVMTKNSSHVVRWEVTNNSPSHVNLRWTGFPGISQIMTPGTCSNPISLAAGQSCVFTLRVVARNLGLQPNTLTTIPIELCQVGPDGNPSPFRCYQTSSSQSLEVTTESETDYGTYFYVPSIHIGGTSLLYRCKMNATSGDLSSCTTSVTIDFSYQSLYGVAISSDSNYAYVIHDDNPSIVAACEVDGSGNFINCGSDLELSDSSYSSSISYKNGHIYIVSFNDKNNVTICTVSGTTISDCVTTSVGDLTVAGTATNNMVSDDHYWYFPGSDYIIKCQLNDEGYLANSGSSVCGIALSSDYLTAYPSGVTIFGDFAYVVSSLDSNMLRCSVDTDYNFVDCETAATDLVEPTGILLDDNLLYVPSFIDPGAIYKCTIDTGTENFGALTCVSLANGLHSPAGSMGVVG